MGNSTNQKILAIGRERLFRMDVYKRLVLQYEGIKDVITQYSSDGHIGNYIKGLGNALAEKDIEAIKYYLNEINGWYQNNINKIQSNEFVYNFDEHVKNMQLLKQHADELSDYKFTLNEGSLVIPDSKSLEPMIFLSHKSDNKKYADALEKLLTSLGVKRGQLIYTSHPLHKIPLGKNIYDFLRENINGSVFVVILWSNEYLTSPACLNEMGAAWVTQSDYTNIYTPDFEFGNPKYHECAVDTRKMGAVLNGNDHCKASMIEFKNKILNYFSLTIDEQTWTFTLDQFLKDIA